MAALGLSLGDVMSAGAVEEAIAEPRPVGAAAAEGCTPEVTITNVERVEIGTLSETFLVRWSTEAVCINEFDVKVEATRQDGSRKTDSKTVGKNDRTALVKVFGSRQDNLSKRVSVLVIGKGVLAGKGTLTSGTTAVATQQPAVATVPTFTLGGVVRDGQGNPIPGVRISFSPAPGGKNLSPTPGKSQNTPAPVQTDGRGVYQQSGFPAGQPFKVTPTKPGFTFNPPSTVIEVKSDRERFDFTGIQSQVFSVSGRVISKDQKGIAGATVTFKLVNASPGQKANLPGPVKSDANGNWSQSGFTKGFTYEANVSKPNFSFKPSAVSIEGPSNSLNFVGAQ
jgi:hypothetical protein